MIALLQRVSEASVSVADEMIAAIGPGLLVLVGVEGADSSATARRMAERIAAYRVFPDDAGKMNLNVVQAGGALLLVPQFTLAADTNTGNRPSFSRAADPGDGRRLFDELVSGCEQLVGRVAIGRFGAHMRVALVNDGPVTFSLRVPPN